jgi:hypothetical protein
VLSAGSSAGAPSGDTPSSRVPPRRHLTRYRLQPTPPFFFYRGVLDANAHGGGCDRRAPPPAAPPRPAGGNTLRFQLRVLPDQRFMWAVKTVQRCYRAYKLSVGLKQGTWRVLRLQVLPPSLTPTPFSAPALQCTAELLRRLRGHTRLYGCNKSAGGDSQRKILSKSWEKVTSPKEL